MLLSIRTERLTSPSSIEVVAERVLDALVENNPDRLDAQLGVPSEHYNGRVGDVPWLPVTSDALHAAGLSDQASLNALAATTWGAVYGQGGHWVPVLDVSVALEHWILTGGHSALDELDDESTLEMVARSLCREIGRQVGANDRAQEALAMRMGWGQDAAILERIGDALGVTRERARQILSPIQRRMPVRRFQLPPCVMEALEVVVSDDGNPLGSELVARGLSDSASWGLDGVVSLTRELGHASLAAAVQESVEQRAKTLECLAEAVRRARSFTGFVDLRAVEDKASTVPADLAFDALAAKYPRSARSGYWAFAATGKRALAETSALQQLAVSRPLAVDELWIGIDRTRRRRHLPALPDARTLVDLLAEVGTVELTSDGLVTAPSSDVLARLGRNEGWLLELLQGSEYSALHMDDVLETARIDGLAESSVGVYCSFASFLRKDVGILYLVGREPSQEAKSLLRQAASARREQTSVEYSAHDSEIVVTLAVGTAAMNSGVIPIRKGLAALLHEAGLSLVCCADWVSAATVKVSNETAWYGFGNLLRHWRDAHGMGVGDTMHLRIRGNMVITDEPWADGAEQAD
jgi:hypothetical protein